MRASARVRLEAAPLDTPTRTHNIPYIARYGIGR